MVLIVPNNTNLPEMDIDQLTINSKISKNTLDDGSKSDADDCDETELQSTFTKKYNLISEKALSLKSNTYILYISCTRETNPKVCVGLSNNICEVHSFENSQINKVATLTHVENIVNVKFSSDINCVYTGSKDGRVQLWDLRNPEKSVVEFTDTTNSDAVKPLVTFDVSPNNRLLCGGTELFKGDAYLLFWDVRNTKLMGGYWESHTDDITAVLFHPTDNNKLATGSTDGLVNTYDLTKTSEDDALESSMNTESSVERLLWHTSAGKESVGCVTNTNDFQLWDPEEANRLTTFTRDYITKGIKRKSTAHCYIANAHINKENSIFLLAGSNWHNGECVRAVTIKNDNLVPDFKLTKNKQRIRCSWFNTETEMLMTGGEQNILSIWQSSSSGYEERMLPLKNADTKQKLHRRTPY